MSEEEEIDAALNNMREKMKKLSNDDVTEGLMCLAEKFLDPRNEVRGAQEQQSWLTAAFLCMEAAARVHLIDHLTEDVRRILSQRN